MGLTATIGQIVLLRELIVLFNGNELSMGIMLAAWLAWTAFGSALAGALPHRVASPRIAIAASLCGLSLPFTIWLLRGARMLFTPIPAEMLGPLPMLLISTACLSVFCALSGALFVLAARLYAVACSTTQPRALAVAYALETAGSGIGGILTSLVLLRCLGPFQIASLVCLLHLFVAFVVLLRPRRRVLAIIAPLAALLALFVTIGLAPRIEVAAQLRSWPGWRVLASRDSIYGRITVTDAGGMRSIYEDGALLANLPDPAAAEESVHFALLEHPAPRRILLIGGGLNGSIAEALQYPSLDRLDYVELDPALTSVFRQQFPAESAPAFSDPRVLAHSGDGRLFLQDSTAQFDVILVNIPDPETAQWNRFYSLEFFRSARARLAPGGILALQVHSSEEFISPQRAEFLRCIHTTLAQVFPHIVLIPGDLAHWFASTQDNVLTEDPALLIARLRARHLHTLYVREYMLPYRMSAERMAEAHAFLHGEGKINRDFHPIAYYFDAVLWTAQFNAGYGILLARIAAVPFRSILLIATALSFLLLLAVLARRASPPSARAAAAWSVTATGFSLMTLQLLLLLAFQCVYGYVYAELAMIIGMFMAGIAAGTGIALRLTRNAAGPPRRGAPAGHRAFVFAPRVADPSRAAALNQLALAACPPLVMVCATLLARATGASIAPIAFPVLALACGLPGGMQFPLAVALHSSPSLGAAPSSTSLYSFDLAGGCLGSLLIAALLIPVYGFWNVAILAAILCAFPALAAAFCVSSALPAPQTPAP